MSHLEPDLELLIESADILTCHGRKSTDVISMVNGRW